MTDITEFLEVDPEWPLCKTTGCQNNRCLRLGSDRCYPHSIGLPKGFSGWEAIKTTNSHKTVSNNG